MEVKQLTELGISEDIAKKVLDINTQELQAETAKVATAETTIKELTGKVKAFDGVDVEGLKKAAADWEGKYNNDLAAAQLDNALNLELVGAGAKNAALVKTLVDTKLLKFDGGKLMGLEEQLKTIKAQNDYLFAPAADPNATPLTVSTGGDHQKPASDDKPITLTGALDDHYNTK